jgi:hypothetical protein
MHPMDLNNLFFVYDIAVEIHRTNFVDLDCSYLAVTICPPGGKITKSASFLISMIAHETRFDGLMIYVLYYSS